MVWMLVEWVEWFTSSLNGMKVVQPPEPLENWLNKQNYSPNSMKTGRTKHTSKVVLQTRPNQPQHESLRYWKQSTLALVGWVWLARLTNKVTKTNMKKKQLIPRLCFTASFHKLLSVHVNEAVQHAQVNFLTPHASSSACFLTLCTSDRF